MFHTPTRGSDANNGAGDSLIGDMQEPLPVLPQTSGSPRNLLDEASSAFEVARVSVKVPPFWKTNPALWFKQVESQFITAGISSDATKFHTIVGSIEANVLNEVSDIILNPPEINMYDALKTRLQERFMDSEEKRLKKLLRDMELGDRKPSAMLREMMDLAAGKVSEELLKSLWMQRLPKQSQAILAVSSESLSRLALMADKISDTSDAWEINVLSKSPSENDNLRLQIEALTKQVEMLSHRSRSHSRQSNKRFKRTNSSKARQSKPFCWYHYKFGDRAKKCVQPCSFTSNSHNVSENH